VHDVVDEQIGGGEVEPTPTPAPGGDVPEKQEEVTEAGGIEQVDQDLEELKVEEDKTEGAESTDMENGSAHLTVSQEPTTSSTPQVTEEETKVDAVTVAEPEQEKEVAVSQAIEPRKQERVENPTYTLETVGNKYKTSNFW
jgi:hypothetical protein